MLLFLQVSRHDVVKDLPWHFEPPGNFPYYQSIITSKEGKNQGEK
jgi:hypothetical protein